MNQHSNHSDIKARSKKTSQNSKTNSQKDYLQRIKENRLKTNSNKTNNRVGKTSSLLTKHEQRKPRVTRLQRNWYKKLGETTERLDV